jgi:hypothetical protein
MGFAAMVKGFWAVEVTVAVAVFEDTAPVVIAVAKFVTDPAVMSACVMVYVAAQLIEAPGATGAAGGQVTVVLLSATVNCALSVMLPVFVTR